MDNKELLSLESASINTSTPLPTSLFKKVEDRGNLHDQAFETKRVSFLRDSFNRFTKNKASIVAAVIILLIALFALIVPLASPRSYVDPVIYPNGFMDDNFSLALPYNPMFKGTGFWDGTKVDTVGSNDYNTYLFDDSNNKYLVNLIEKKEDRVGSTVSYSYVVRLNTYYRGNILVKMQKEKYEDFISYQKEKGIYQTEKSIDKPLVDSATYLAAYKQSLLDEGFALTSVNNVIDKMTNQYNQKSGIFYELSAKNKKGELVDNIFTPVVDNNGQVKEIYKRDTNGNLVYFESHGGEYTVRVDSFDYSTYYNGFEPYYFFGANKSGQDIFLRLALGTRFSLLLGISISAINFLIGLLWGAISGYYGGAADLVMERITDIISNVPSIIVLSICAVQFTNNAGLKAVFGDGGLVILAFLIAFVYSGWIGVASTTRMQFYRFKGQEYVLASRTLGAKDSRLIFKHILPNAAGTLVTSSVLMIPSVIFSETSLSYLGIVNFSTSGIVSIGSLLNEGQAAGLQYAPHMLLFPCIIISLLMICFNLFGNGLRDAFNTSLKGSEE